MKLGYFSTQEPDLRPVPKTNYKRLHQSIKEPFYYLSANRQYVITAPDRMKTDEGSIPTPVQWLPKLDDSYYCAGYILHDGMYYFKTALKRKVATEELNERELNILVHGIFEEDETLRNMVWEGAFTVQPISRIFADSYLDEMIETQEDGDAQIIRAIINTAVRLFGWFPWWNYSRRKLRNESDDLPAEPLCAT